MRQEFQTEIENLKPEEIVWLDESGIEDNICFEYGWSDKGKRCYDEKVGRHKIRISIIAGLNNKKLIAPFMFEGTCNKELFEAYIENIFIKELKSKQTVIMDNINFHKTDKIKELIEGVGCKIIFLPTYSPDLNPIEKQWFKVKNKIRKTKQNFLTFAQAVSNSLVHYCS